MHTVKYLLFLALLLALSSCGINRYLPEGERLYTGAEFDLEAEVNRSTERKLISELSGVVRPDPNNVVLGGRPALRWHLRANSEKSNFLNRFLDRRFGEEPVLKSAVNIERNKVIILNRLENNGFFNASVRHEWDTSSTRKASLIYFIEAAKPFVIGTFQYEGGGRKIDRLIAASLEESLIEVGMRYDLAQFRRERQRILNFLLEEGFYFFTADYLHFSIDTTDGVSGLDVFLQIKEGIPEEALIPYRIRDITIFPDQTLRPGTEPEPEVNRVELENYTVICRDLDFRPDRFENYLLFSPGDLYRKTASDRTRQRLFSIGAFGFVNVRHRLVDTTEVDGEKYGWLSTNIRLSPSNRMNLRAELQVVSKSNNFMGPLFTGEYRNRNLFGGGEQLNLGLRFGYETQVAGGRQSGLSAFEAGVFGELVFPRIIAPIRWKDNTQYGVPRTKIKMSYSLLNRVRRYQLRSLNFTYGYTWHGNRYAFHQINPIALNFTTLPKTSEEFQKILDGNPFLQRSFEQQFIPGAEYLFSFNQLLQQDRSRHILFQFRLDIAGNLASLVDGVFNDEKKNRLFRREYARYLRTDIDLRHYIRVGSEGRLVARVFAGIGIPLGNSLSLPYIKQYFSGGPNSVRAFRIRSLGPGIYRPEAIDGASFFDQAGDIRIEANIEYRFPIFGFFKGALFADAGNIWLYNENEAIPGGQFSSDWAEQLAVGAGMGVRMDLDFFVVRLDLASPLRKPWIEDGSRWNTDWRPLKKSWRKENLIWNIAIGYPF
ncbi:MAG: hypothetical protein EA409_07060 [Saprospirales bacterium]|nr:MAG: hypothetical protein EA409_07060 [Saprospirales bacterium]